MKAFFIVLIIVATFLVVSSIVSYIIASKIFKQAFSRQDFRENCELLSYNDVKDKYPRVEYSFKSGKNTLKAYLYGSLGQRGFIVYVHGLCPGHQGYLSDISALVDRGYKVFTYDFTATGQSEGKYFSGLDQQKKDLKACLKFLQESSEFRNNDIYLYGHSMGAYGVSACQNFSDKIKASVAISGYDRPYQEIMSSINDPNKKFFHFISIYPIFIKLFIDNGFNFNTSASKEISKSNKPILIVHGTKDETVPLDKVSIYSKKDKIKNKNASFLLMEDEYHNTHNSVIASTECVKYQRTRMEIFNEVYKETKSKASAYQKAFIDEIDRFKFNVANDDLMEIIDKFYQSTK